MAKPPTVALPAEWERLDRATRALVGEHEALRKRARDAEARARTFEAALRRLAAGDLDPAKIAGRIRVLEEENRRLREQLEQARAVVERARARLDFLEESR